MLLATVASCCDMLGVVRSNLKMVIFFMRHLWMLHDVVVIWPGSCNNVVPVHGDCVLVRCRNMLQHRGQTCTTCCSQQCCDLLHSNVAIAWLELANARPTMLGYVVLRCCDHLAGASVTNTQHFDNLLSPISNANGRSLVLGACNQIACPYFLIQVFLKYLTLTYPNTTFYFLLFHTSQPWELTKCIITGVLGV